MEQPALTPTGQPRRRRKVGRYILLVFLVSGGTYWWYRNSQRQVVPVPAFTVLQNAEGPVVMAPPNVRIKVEVVNATTVRGLGRRATLYLRDRGFDVVGIGTSRELRDSTLVLSRSGHNDWATLVARALNARVQSRPDSSRFVDVTVLIGADWRPPAVPLYP